MALCPHSLSLMAREVGPPHRVVRPRPQGKPCTWDSKQTLSSLLTSKGHTQSQNATSNTLQSQCIQTSHVSQSTDPQSYIHVLVHCMWTCISDKSTHEVAMAAAGSVVVVAAEVGVVFSAMLM